ncbi:MAG TPA: lytic transglycosylase domain-containing protein [Vicinamibacterales bacterium]|nr:lytic transglycosylase domain-containing protein [Vicinamibacterales bacterium]
MTRLRGFAPVTAALLVLGAAAPAAAELVFLANGRTLSVRSHRVDGDRVVLQLRTGGEIVCDRALVARIEPDEVPYPEPPPSAPAALGEWPVYGELIDRLAAAHGVDPRLVRAVVQVESAFEPRARSPKGALGLMQLMPATAREHGVADPFDPHENLEGGIRHLRRLLERYELRLALAAYNAGERAVQRFGGIPPYRETRAYVARVLSLVRSASR